MTARQFAWSEVVKRNLLPRFELSTIRDIASRDCSKWRVTADQQAPLLRSRRREDRGSSTPRRCRLGCRHGGAGGYQVD